MNSTSRDILIFPDIPLPKTKMTMEIPPFEDVSPIQNGDFSPVMLVFGRVIFPKKKHNAKV